MTGHHEGRHLGHRRLRRRRCSERHQPRCSHHQSSSCCQYRLFSTRLTERIRGKSSGASHNPRGWVRVDLLGQADFDASGKYIHLDAGYGDLFANSRQSRKDMPGQSRRGVGGVPAWWWQIGARRSCGTGARIPGMKGASLLGMKAGSGFVTTTTPTLPRTRPLPVVRRLYGIGEDLSLQERICTNCCVDTTRS